MTVLQYLNIRADVLRLEKAEADKIDLSLMALQTRLRTSLYDKGVRDVKIFGSYDRDTMLPRSVDSQSDVDVMVIFNDTIPNLYQPQTYLCRLKEFADNKYPLSVCNQDWPAVTLKLGFIKYDLVPAVKSYFGTGFQIPGQKDGLVKWINTNPDDLKRMVQSANRMNDYIVKKVIRLLKFWNVSNGHPFATFDLETKIARNGFAFDRNIQQYLTTAVSSLTVIGDNNRAKFARLQSDMAVADSLYNMGREQESLAIYQRYFGKVSVI